MPRKIPFLTGSLHILALSGFALAQPLYSLLSGYPEFFVARQSEPVDPILLALILSLGLPSLLILFEGLARAAGHGLHTHVHATLVSVLTTAILLQLLNYIPALPGVVSVSAAVLLAMMVSLGLSSFRYDPDLPDVPGAGRSVVPRLVSSELRCLENRFPETGGDSTGRGRGDCSRSDGGSG